MSGLTPPRGLLKIPTFSTSASTPNLTKLEKRISLSRSTDDTFLHPASHSTTDLSTLSAGHLSIAIPELDLHGIEMISSSAPGSLQSSPKRNKEFIAFPATPEVVDRPRTLPPKSPAELQRHIKEYEEISKQIKKAMEKEAKDKVKKDGLKFNREKKLVEYRKVWIEEILPNWETKHNSKKALEMWRIGLPPSLRGQIWKLSLGNELMITKELFDISKGHAQQTKETMFGFTAPKLSLPDGATSVRTSRGAVLAPVPMDELLGKEGTVVLVSMDLPADFPARELFVQGGPMNKQLDEVLEAYVAYRPDVGYVPTMSYLVAGFLLNMESLDAFICLANFINQPFNLALYITDRSRMYKYTSAADGIISTLLPKVHKHFQELNIELEIVIVEWFMTIFLKPLPIDIAARVWDIYFLEGEIFLFKVALALLKMYSHQFETYPKDLCLNLLTKFPKDLSEDVLFDTIAQFNLDPKKFHKLLET